MFCLYQWWKISLLFICFITPSTLLYFGYFPVYCFFNKTAMIILTRIGMVMSVFTRTPTSHAKNSHWPANNHIRDCKNTFKYCTAPGYISGVKRHRAGAVYKSQCVSEE